MVLTPAKPKTEGSKELKGNRVASDIARLVVGVAIMIIKAANAGAEDDSHDQGDHTAGHVDRSRTSEVDDSTAPEGIGVGVGQKSVDRPEAVRHNRVDKACQEGGVEEVGGHLAALGDGAGDDGRQSAAEGELEEPLLHVDVLHEEEVGVTNEGGATCGIVAAIGEGVSHAPEGNAAAGGIEEIPQQDVLAVLATDGSGTKHGEARLHEVDEGAVEEEGAIEIIGM